MSGLGSIDVRPTVSSYAADLTLRVFREADRLGIHRIYCERVPAGGIGDAVLDRLSRAAES